MISPFLPILHKPSFLQLVGYLVILVTSL